MYDTASGHAERCFLLTAPSFDCLCGLLLGDTEFGYYIDKSKTNKGVRQLTMSEKSYRVFKRVIKNRRKAELIVNEGYSSFLFLNREGLPKVTGNYEGIV